VGGASRPDDAVIDDVAGRRPYRSIVCRDAYLLDFSQVLVAAVH